MSPKFLNFEFILLYFLLLIPWPPLQIIKSFCSQDNSRLVRKIVRSKWTPILDKYQVKLPLECPLHPFRDLFAPRQDAKKRDRPTQWTCRLCGKSFYQEKFLDLHFETRHKSIKNEAEDAVCLADLCDIMRCEVFQTEESSSLKIGDQHIITDIEVWGDSLGQNSALAKANAVYLSLMPVRTSAIGATRAAKVQNRQLCQDKIGQNKFKDTADYPTARDEKSKYIINDATRKKEQSAAASSVRGSNSKPSKAQKVSLPKYKKNQSDELNGDESNDSADNSTQNGTQDNGNNIQKVRSNCKPEELSKLKAKCEYLVRNCIGGLLLSLNDQSFKEMEEEMNKAVCWYLSCDRYWEDGPLEPRAFPWGLILILILVLSTGICFCYYIIWILFDSEEATINASNHHMYMPAYPQYPIGPGGGTLGQPGQPGPQPYYYQQQQLAHDLYPEPPQYDYRHSPRRYIADTRQQGTPTAGGVHNLTGGSTTPLHHRTHPHQTNLVGYPQDILDPRDYTSSLSRGIATTAVSSGLGGPNAGTTNVSTSALNTVSGGPGAGAGAGANTVNLGHLDYDAAANVGNKHHYNTHPRPLDTQHRHAGASQQSLRTSSSTHEIIQNEIGHNEHYIYVTYPPDLKKRFFEKYE